MGFDIVLGRSAKDYKKLGTEASMLIGKHYVTMGKTVSLANDIYVDVNGSHVILICGKRGGGKSYTMGVMAEAILGLPKEVKDNIGMIFFDTMGLYWTTKYPNYKQSNDLMNWNLEPKGFADSVVVYCPAGYFDYYKEKNVPVDKPFTVDPADLSPSEWSMVFGISSNDEIGVCIERAINQIKKKKAKYSISDIKKEIESDKTFSQITKLGSINRFEIAESWGLFSENATPLSELVKKGIMSIIDISIYVSAAAEFDIRSLVIGLICRRLLNSRMVVRKTEELGDVEKSTTYFSSSVEDKGKTDSKEIPIVWVFVDEAHEFLPPAPAKTLATDALVQILREGRQPGVNLVLATQQPGKIHTDAITQADIILSHRLTADLDIKALEAAMGSFTSVNLFKMMNDLPKTKGSAIVMDDLNENVYPMQVRPRFTWHGGGSPTVLSNEYQTKDVPEEY
ncbi:MAG: DUF87 domain-containing protein [Candidatus Nanoarchaeia archaeon]|jgi:hypothetical protein